MVVPTAANTTADDPRMVLLNVYDLTHYKFVEAFNQLAVPLGAGGFFHVAIEVWEQEWNYGGSQKGTGITSVSPGKDPAHNFRASIPLGLTELSKRQVQEVILEFAGEWQGTGYDCIRRNCCSFAQALAQRLGVGPLPGWVDRLCRTAAGVLTPLDNALALVTATGNLERCCGKSMVILPPTDV
mmetsp:Transcript_81182/g.181634  ORF Transcript_81182/g.181634 Transcript_81182/m.181634 type:complete len:184 (-) Transcript_81182:157-708(-)